MLSEDEQYMQRCIQLARLGEGLVAPNPMVGAILVYQNQIIGEGYHEQYGQAHAEVNCLNSVRKENKQLIEQAVLYVSLEPCAHFGKTPPCSDLIIQNKISKVIIGCRDPFEKVNGKGIEKLLAAGVEVKIGILEKECIKLNKRFFTFHQKQRPYIILKWAQTFDKKISADNNKQLKISNELTDRLVHNWRSKEAGILIGTNTALMDNPLLTNRLWTGKNSVRLIVDKNLKIPKTSKIFNADAATIVFNFLENTIDLENKLKSQVYYFQVDTNENLLKQIGVACYKLNIQSVFVEGGTKLLQSFIDEHFYDEIRIITNEKKIINKGLPAPEFLPGNLIGEYYLLNDSIRIFQY